MLTGREIAKQVALGRIRIKPFNPDQCNPDSYDFRLGPFLRILRCNSKFNGVRCIDPRLLQKYTQVEIPDSGYLLRVGRCYLGTTIEKLGSDYYPSQVTGKSGVGRIFIRTHCDADHIDRGFFGHLTLEITVQIPTVIFPGMRFGQIKWFESVGKKGELYHGKYLNDSAAAASRIHLELTHGGSK